MGGGIQYDRTLDTNLPVYLPISDTGRTGETGKSGTQVMGKVITFNTTLIHDTCGRYLWSYTSLPVVIRLLPVVAHL